MDAFIQIGLAASWFLIPAGAANVVPVVAAKLLPTWDWPVDFGWRVRGQRLFGSHKTWRGLGTGILAAAAAFALQKAAFGHVPFVHEFSAIAYDQYSWLLGASMGAAALAGDLAKSLVKRQLNIVPGHSWFPFDQIDWLLGALIFSYLCFDLTISFGLAVLFVGVGLHAATHFLGYVLRFNETGI